MEFAFGYNKQKVIQALRLHFIARKEIKAMIIIVNLFVLVAAILFYTKKIRPEPFLLGTFIWLLMLVAIWYILPYSIYKKTSTFKDNFTIWINENSIRLENQKGYVTWQWNMFSSYFESPNFFHLYFNEKSFFLLPKESIDENVISDLKNLLINKFKK